MGMCATCHGGCCRSFAVPVSGADIIRIETERGLSFWEFMCRWADPEGRIARNHAPHFFFEDEPDTPFTICLMHEASRFFPGTTKCLFLQETPADTEHPLGLAQCGIYESRPHTCRAFPTRLNASGELAILYDVPARGRDGDEPVYSLCPRPWELSDLDPISTVQDLVVAKYEMDLFHTLADYWNQCRGPWNAFPDFLHMVYAGRVIRDSAPEAADSQHDVTRQFPRKAA